MPGKAHRKNEPAHSVSVAYLRPLLTLGAKLNVEPQALLAKTGISPWQLEQADSRVDSHEIGRMAWRLKQLTGHDNIGMEYGLLLPATAHGHLTYAAMSCTTLFEVMQLAHKYLRLYFSDFTEWAEVVDGTVVVSLAESYALGPIRQIFFEALLSTLSRQLSQLLGQPLADWTVHVDWPEPVYFAAYRDRLPPWRFDEPRIQIRFPKSYLTSAPIMADSLAFKQALAHIEKEAVARASVPDIVTRVREALRNASSGYPGAREVAQQLLMSERTLVRRLSEAGTSFHLILRDERLRRALELIRAGQLNLQQIAQVLGYTELATFTRAFKRWTGRCPSELREK